MATNSVLLHTARKILIYLLTFTQHSKYIDDVDDGYTVTVITSSVATSKHSVIVAAVF